jgi:hypothetical protein
MEVHSAVLLQEVTLRNYRDVTERTLLAASDAHSTEDEDISVQSDSATGDNTNTNFTQWTDNTNCPTVPAVHKFTGDSGGLPQTEAPHTNKDFHIQQCHDLLFGNYIVAC